MATNSMVPYSNPAGNNQTTPQLSNNPSPILNGLPGGAGVATANPVLNPGTIAQQNPFVPITSGAVTGVASGTAGAGTVPSGTQTTSSNGATANTAAADGFITNNSSYSSGENDLQKQLIDIYGKGVGGSEFALLNNMSGTDSTILQEYIQGLQPQEAQGHANLNASLGAGGVGANSSVAALGNANLQAQEFAQISNESANLTNQQEQTTAQILEGMQGDSSKEVASSDWDVLSQVVPAAGSLVSTFLK